MSFDRSLRIQELFDAVLARPRDERRAWLLTACRRDAALHAAVSLRLEEHEHLEHTVEAAAPPQARPADPTAIGRFEVLERLGVGGMGAVYLARDPAIDRLVAIKVLRDDYANDTAFDRFQREARAAGSLRHPNIVTIFDYGQEHGQPFLVMEYVPGRTLSAVIADQQPLSLATKLRMIEQICDGLACAHQAKYIHRDIKPSNIIVDDDGRIRIVDFGIVKPRFANPDRTATVVTAAHTVVGTVGYIAPEHLAGTEIDYLGDMFAASVVAYELLTYHRPFGSDVGTINRRILLGQSVPIESVAPHLPTDVREAVSRGMALRPDERHRDMATMARALRQAREAIDAATVQEQVPTLFDAEPETHARRGVWFGGAAVVAGIVTLAAWLSSGGTGSRQTPERSPAPPASNATAEPREIGRPEPPVVPASQPGPATRATAPQAAALQATAPRVSSDRARPGSDTRSAPAPPAPERASGDARPYGQPQPAADSLLATGTGSALTAAGPAAAAPVPGDAPAVGIAAPAPANPPVGPTAADDRAGITRTLVAFERAFRDGSTPALKRVQPSLTREQLAVFDRRFLDNVSYIVKVRNERITFESPTVAHVTCLLDEDYTPFAGEPQHVSSPASIDLALEGSLWVVTRVRSQNWR